MDANTQSLAEALFRPESFFLGRTEGSGVVRDPMGRISRRCRIVTEGAAKPGGGAFQFDETYTYDDGEVDVWRWAMTRGRDGQYVAAEAVAGPGITGANVGTDYLLTFKRAVGQAHGLLAPTFRTRFTLLTPDLALKSARVSLLGVPLGTLTAIHQRIPD